MVLPARAEVFDPKEVAVAPVYNRIYNQTVRRCFLMGDDAVSGKSFDYRKVWIKEYLRQFAAAFGVDLLGFAILSNHFHLILRSRPDVVATWDYREVARRSSQAITRRCKDKSKQFPNKKLRPKKRTAFHQAMRSYRRLRSTSRPIRTRRIQNDDS